MKGTHYRTKEDVLKRAQEVIGIPLGEIDKTNKLRVGKGAVGSVIEESWFGYKVNNQSEPDFPEAGVELKTTPYVRVKRDSIRAKERLVCNIIDYMTEWEKTFQTSSFWHKCETLLIMAYEHKYNVSKADYTIDKAILFSYPEEDLVIIEQDWRKIIGKIRQGFAHLLTEGDTLYLAACTKGSTAEDSLRVQPFGLPLAKQRAYALKQSYMTRILQEYVFGQKTNERVVKDWRELSDDGFEGYLIRKVQPYYGKTQGQLKQILKVDSSAKNVNEILLARMLNVNGKVAQTKEFLNAQIIPKTIRIEANGRIKESMSFPTFRFTEIIEQSWEDSDLRNYLEPTKFLFVVFRKQAGCDYAFEKVFFWNIPYDDLQEVRRVWEQTVQTIKDGVEIVTVNEMTKNNLPKATQSSVAHVRPHGRNKDDVYPLPDGRLLTKQCFWLNREYIEKIVRENLNGYKIPSSLRA